VSDEDYGRVPAGWYPDPLGLPQLRWWDNHAWTEHVSDARQPMMASQTAASTMFADDELPSRDEQPPTKTHVVDAYPLDDAVTAGLLQLPPPSDDDLLSTNAPSTAAADTAAEAAATTASASTASAADAFAAAAFADLHPQSAGTASGQPSMPWLPVQNDVQSAGVGSAPHGYATSPAYSSAPGYGSAPGGPSSVPSWGEAPVSASEPSRRGVHQSVGTTALHLQTVEVWAIVLMPMLQLLLSLLVVAAFATGPSVAFMAAIWLGPVPVIVALALFDSRTLKRRGVDRPASGWWAIVSAPVYLMARAVRLGRISGTAFAPLGVALLLGGLIGASVLAVPGLLISAFPAVFASEASNSIELTARSIGGAMMVDCPPTPPLFIGQQLRCPATDSNGNPVVITVSLQRSNGWIAWQVDDWGVFSLTR
jgi:Protein of unknown function (DUF2510)